MKEIADIHTHILPGVDDGAEDTAQALALLKLAWDRGTRELVLTPHYRGCYRLRADRLRAVFAQLQEAAGKQLPGLRLYLGQEICCEGNAIEALAEGRVLSIRDTGYALLEFSPGASRKLLEENVETAVYYGFTPVIAHGERCDILRRDRRLLDRLLDRGALLQLNADSILGRHGWAKKRFCHRMLKTQRASFVASDAHDLQFRPPVLDECYAHIEKKYGGEYARRVFWENPITMLDNQKI